MTGAGTACNLIGAQEAKAAREVRHERRRPEKGCFCQSLAQGALDMKLTEGHYITSSRLHTKPQTQLARRVLFAVTNRDDTAFPSPVTPLGSVCGGRGGGGAHWSAPELLTSHWLWISGYLAIYIYFFFWSRGGYRVKHCGIDSSTSTRQQEIGSHWFKIGNTCKIWLYFCCCVASSTPRFQKHDISRNMRKLVIAIILSYYWNRLTNAVKSTFVLAFSLATRRHFHFRVSLQQRAHSFRKKCDWTATIWGEELRWWSSRRKGNTFSTLHVLLYRR